MDDDDITRRRIDKELPEDYYLQLEIRGYIRGTTGKVRWLIAPIAWSKNIDPEDAEYMAEIFDRIAEVLRQ